MQMTPIAYRRRVVVGGGVGRFESYAPDSPWVSGFEDFHPVKAGERRTVAMAITFEKTDNGWRRKENAAHELLRARKQ
jgi:hypothetical protein